MLHKWRKKETSRIKLSEDIELNWVGLDWVWTRSTLLILIGLVSDCCDVNPNVQIPTPVGVIHSTHTTPLSRASIPSLYHPDLIISPIHHSSPHDQAPFSNHRPSTKEIRRLRHLSILSLSYTNTKLQSTEEE